MDAARSARCSRVAAVARNACLPASNGKRHGHVHPHVVAPAPPACAARAGRSRRSRRRTPACRPSWRDPRAGPRAPARRTGPSPPAPPPPGPRGSGGRPGPPPPRSRAAGRRPPSRAGPRSAARAPPSSAPARRRSAPPRARSPGCWADRCSTSSLQRRTASSITRWRWSSDALRGREPGAAGDLPEEGAEAHHPRAEDRAALGQLALAVLHLLEGRHHQDRLLGQALAQRARARLPPWRRWPAR